MGIVGELYPLANPDLLSRVLSVGLVLVSFFLFLIPRARSLLFAMHVLCTRPPGMFFLK